MTLYYSYNGAKSMKIKEIKTPDYKAYKHDKSTYGYSAGKATPI